MPPASSLATALLALLAGEPLATTDRHQLARFVLRALRAGIPWR